MWIGNERDKRFLANSIFPSFLYAILALVFGQVGAAQMHGSWSLRAFMGAPGLVLAGLALYRARLHWAAVQATTPSSLARASGRYVALLAAGVSIGILVSAGSVLLLGVVATLTYVFPWNRIPACRSRFVVASLVMLAGAIAWVVIRGRPDQALYFMIAAWILYIPPTCMQLLILAVLDYEYRIHASHGTGKSGLGGHVPLPE